MPLDNERKKKLRSLGHSLKPVVTVAGNGLSENVLAEINRALDDHELIKVRIKVGSRKAKEVIIKNLCETCDAELVQSIGNVILILREAGDKKPRLSNLITGRKA